MSQSPYDLAAYQTLLAQRAITRILLEIGVSSVNSCVLERLAQILQLIISNIAVATKRSSQLGRRSSPNAFDFLFSFRDLKISLPKACLFLEKAKRTSLAKKETQSPAVARPPISQSKCIKLETNYRPKHFYDHLPQFPSVHTFKKTASRIPPISDRALLAYRKADERHAVERNLHSFFREYFREIALHSQE